MCQKYHANAVTNVHVRSAINKSGSSRAALSERYGVSGNTVSKWKDRGFMGDKSSRPDNVRYALSELEKGLAASVRTSSWLPLDEVHEALLAINPGISRSAVYRALAAGNISTVPAPEKEKAKKFKAYEPGYLHVDVTYLPKLGGTKHYLFVAIDRATRLLYYKVYDAKTAENAQCFFDGCMSFFPFVLTHILTDNGLEFTNKLIRSKKGSLCTKPSLLDERCAKNNIEHRLTKPSTPKTNGMVERVNGTIKNNTVLRTDYQNKAEMDEDLLRFLVAYNLYRRHGSLKKELGVRTPFEAMEKWHALKPEIFKETPASFKEKILGLKNQTIPKIPQQPCET